MIITDFLERNAREYGDEICLTEINPEKRTSSRLLWKDYALVEQGEETGYRKQMTWKEFDAQANRIANILLSRGIKKGDKVAILLMNCLEWLPIYFGILKTGALAVPMNYRYTGDEIKYCLSLSDAETLIFGPEFIGRIESVYDSIDVKNLFFAGEPCPTFAEDLLKLEKTACDKKPAIDITKDDFAAIYFSSGTTGFPKAILHRHDALVSACECEQAHHSQTRQDKFLCMPPLYHTGAKMHWFGSLYSGSGAVLLRGISPKWILETVSQEKVSIVWLLVPWAQDILDAIESGDIDLKDYDLSKWRLMHIGAQPVPPSLIKRWKKYFPHHDYDTNYGLSESIGPGCVHLGVENIDKVGAIGVPGHNWQAKIVDDRRQEVKDGQVGELAVKGRGVMICYYKDENATKEVLDQDGWLYTGDMAKKVDGFIYLVDRKKDVIIMGGENLYPVQIEDFLRTNDKIKDVAVIGIPDERLGEIACAIIELKENCTSDEKEMSEFCNSLPRYKRPRKFIFAKVPRNPTGKIEKPRLRSMYGGGNLIEAQIK